MALRSAAPAGGKPAFWRTAEELGEHVARLGVERVAELLKVDPCDVAGMLEGRVEPPKSGLVRLRRAAAEVDNVSF